MKSAYGCRAIIAVQPGIQGSPVREHIILLPADNPSRNSIHPGGGRCTEHLDVLSEAYAVTAVPAVTSASYRSPAISGNVKADCSAASQLSQSPPRIRQSPRSAFAFAWLFVSYSVVDQMSVRQDVRARPDARPLDRL